MIATYIRVSTATQNTITQEVKSQGREYIDKIQGVTPFAERPAGSMLLNDIITGRIKHVYVNRIDRLGRNALDILNTIEILKKYKCQLTVTSMGLNLFESGKLNNAFMLVVSLYAQLAEQQREEIKEKTAEGIKIARDNGVYKGRKKGSIVSDQQFLINHKDIVNCVEKGMSLNKTVETTGKSKPTVIKVKKLLFPKEQHRQTTLQEQIAKAEQQKK